MEDCISEAPSAFLRRQVKVIARQPKIGGFRPDLLLEDDRGLPLIVEIQQRAIDRNHLYRCLEYRDSTSTEGKKATVVLVCEKLDPRFEPIAKSHAVEVLTIGRDEFIALAVKHCSRSLTHHLTTSDAAEDDDKGNVREIQDGHRIPDLEAQFSEIDWSGVRGPFDVLSFLNKEFGRLGISHWNIPREYFGHIHMQLEDFLNAGIFHARHKIDKFWIVNEARRSEQKSSSAPAIVGPVYHQRPPIQVHAYVTSKGNLSVCWDVDLYRKDTPWVIGPSSDHLGWSRPQNELLFLRDVDNLKFRRARQYSATSLINWDVLSGIYIAFIRTSYDYLVQMLMQNYAVEKQTDFEFKTYSLSDESKPWRSETRIEEWDIFNVEERQKQAEGQWRSNLKKEIGITAEEFVARYNEAAIQRQGETYRVSGDLSRALKKEGTRVTIGQINDIVDRIRTFHPDLNWKLKS